MTAFIAAAPATPGSFPPRSPVAYTLVAPNSPSPAAKLSASPATNAVTDEPTSRALVSSSWVAVVGLAVGALGEDPDVGNGHDDSFPSSCVRAQMTLSLSRNSTIFV